MLPEIEQQIEFLQNVQILIELSEGDLAAVAERLKHVQYQSDELIFSQGDEGDNLYFIQRGRVRVIRFDEEHEEDIEVP